MRELRCPKCNSEALTHLTFNKMWCTSCDCVSRIKFSMADPTLDNGDLVEQDNKESKSMLFSEEEIRFLKMLMRLGAVVVKYDDALFNTTDIVELCNKLGIDCYEEVL